MVLVVKCLICQKELPYSQSNPLELIQHIKLDHASERISRQNLREKVDKEVETSFVENSRILHNLIDKSSQTDRFKKMNSGRRRYLFKKIKIL